MGGIGLNFSFIDYQRGRERGMYYPPEAYRPFLSINRAQYKALEKVHEKNKNDIITAFRELRRRVDSRYYWRTYPIQARALHYSQMSFPAYRFILPEVLTDDWLAIVDWHKFQRDHILHQPMTAYVVQKLLKGGGDSNEPFRLIDGRFLLDACVDEILKWQETEFLRDYLIETGVRSSEPWLDDGPTCKTLWSSLFIEAAYLAAMFHDMGYPWQYIHLLTNKLEHAEYQPRYPNANAERLVSSFGERLLYCPPNGYRHLDRNAPSTWHQQLIDLTAKSLRITHGFPGAIGFLYLNDVLRDYPAGHSHPIRQFCVEWAAMAIMMHDMAKIYWGNDASSPPDNIHMRLKFEIDPLSCVVTLADVLQEFSRPIASFQENAGVVEVSYLDGCDSTSLELEPLTGDMKIVYGFRDERQRASKLHWMPAEHHEYFDQRYGYLDLSAAGVGRVDMETLLLP
jgi:hypothetical protein